MLMSYEDKPATRPRGKRSKPAEPPVPLPPVVEPDPVDELPA
jgi:hypothetical protein